MTYFDITKDLPHCFNDAGVCVYCDNAAYEIDPDDSEIDHCDARAHFEAQR